jgi:hypothetical protein
MLNNETKLWRNQKEPSFYVTTEIRKYIDYSNKQLVNKIALLNGKEKDEMIDDLIAVYHLLDTTEEAEQFVSTELKMIGYRLN